jgi:hypothetical protein
MMIWITQIYSYIIKHTYANHFYLWALNLHMKHFTITYTVYSKLFLQTLNTI